MNGAALRSSGSTRAGFVQGLFSVCTGGMVGAGAARSGRRTPEPHVWPAAPLQFMRGDGWRGAAVDKEIDVRWANGDWMSFAETLELLASSSLCEQLQKEIFSLSRHPDQNWDVWRMWVHWRNADLKGRGPYLPEGFQNIDTLWGSISENIIDELNNKNICFRLLNVKEKKFELFPGAMWNYYRIVPPNKNVTNIREFFSGVGAHQAKDLYADWREKCIILEGNRFECRQIIRLAPQEIQQRSVSVTHVESLSPSLKEPGKRLSDEKLIEAAVDEDERRFKNNEALMDQKERFKFLNDKYGKLSFNHFRTVLTPEIRKLAKKRGVKLRGRGDSRK